MKTNRMSIGAGILLTVVFCLLVLHNEREAVGRAQAHIEELARIIAAPLWNYNPQGADEYLQLAAATRAYESLRIEYATGEVFQEIHTPLSTALERQLDRLHLIPRVPLGVQIRHAGQPIGWVEVVWRPRTIFTHAYLFLALFMVFIILHLVLHLVKSKSHLEKRVRTRTAELHASNVALQREIGERIQAESELRLSEAKHRLLAENIQDVIWIIDLEMNVTYFSPASEKMHGWTSDELETVTISDLLPPDSLQRASELIIENLARARAEGDYGISVATEIEQYRKDRSRFWTEVNASFLLDDNGQPCGILGVTRDITERKETEREKLKLQARLERSKKMEWLGLMAGGVAHDLNNVLAGIVSYPDLLLLDLPPESPLVAPIETIKDSGRKAAAIVQDLLTLARRGVISQEVHNLNPLIEDYLQSPEHQKIISYHPGVRVEVDLQFNLPNIKGSPVHIKKTIMNLVSNAAEAQPQGGCIDISTRSLYIDTPITGYQTVAEGDYILLQIRDRGEGIGREDLEHIFEPFYTKKTMGRSGTGLGLAVVWGTIQDHNGYINVSSAKDCGTTFELYFPLTRESMGNGSGDQLINEPPKGNHEFILVVDDKPSQREIAQRLLKRLNYLVHTVESGEAALAYLKENTVDLVLLDMIMNPGIDGLETYQRILNMHPTQKAIIASGFAETERVKTALGLGAGLYLRKPYMIDNLARSLRKILDGSEIKSKDSAPVAEKA